MLGYKASLVACLIGGMSSGAALAQSAPTVDWSGFYVGGLVGATNSQTQAKTTVGYQKYLNATDAAQMARAGDSGLAQWQPSAGLVGGYGKQFGHILLGLEASANSIYLNDERTVSENYVTAPASRFILRQSVRADWMASLRPRLGWAEDNWLGYVTGGLSVTQLKLDTLFVDNAWSGYSKSSDTEIRTGWSLGLGGEYALSGGWALRGEYLYTNFGALKSMSETTSTNDSGGSLAHKADLDTHAVMVGLTYRFKGF
ncbi:outer membrane protein [Magnetospirillum sulfuroxidans]|uniref:Porin family protein n=1 Tax=Magnetospirillum sulfuroxidans TaxID=611300 RepID=A0ABS5IAX8_9PROT|nr:outer membrane beta-barrel protein [Magnetospirillum sulfuroxidans]MBR9971587.1 porin family protein [Magnetospirillum sulfuroxidans]